MTTKTKKDLPPNIVYEDGKFFEVTVPVEQPKPVVAEALPAPQPQVIKQPVNVPKSSVGWKQGLGWITASFFAGAFVFTWYLIWVGVI